MPDNQTLAAQLADCKALLATTAAERDAARAEMAMLGETLEPIVVAWSARTVSEDGTTMRVDIPFAYLRKARAALTADPGEWLEGVKRQAQIEALEGLPCRDADAQRGKSCIECGTALFCQRCKALAELKGGQVITRKCRCGSPHDNWPDGAGGWLCQLCWESMADEMWWAAMRGELNSPRLSEPKGGK